MKHFSELSPSAERIVDAAERLIQAVGYNGFSYEDVAQIVGIRKPSIHHHFPSKADLGAVVAQRYTHRFMEKLNNIHRDQATVSDRMRAYARLFEETYAKDRRLCVCGMLGAESLGLPTEVNHEVKQFFEQNLEWLTDVLCQGVAAGQVTLHSTPAAVAELFMSALEGSMLLGRARQSAQGPQQVTDALFSSMWV